MSPDQRLNRTIRYCTAGVSALTAAIYFLIGFNVISVLEHGADQQFGLFAGVGYLLGALLLIATDHQIVLLLGALLQIFVIYTYFNLASQRTPTYEIWGILLRVAQFLILIALTYLLYHTTRRQRYEEGAGQGQEPRLRGS